MTRCTNKNANHSWTNKQEKQYEQFEVCILEILTQQMKLSHRGLTNDLCNSHTNFIINSIHEFQSIHLSGNTFESWFKKYEDLFKVDFNKFDHACKVEMLLRKLGTVEHECYSNFILSKSSRGLRSDATINILSQIFTVQSSLLNIRSG